MIPFPKGVTKTPNTLIGIQNPERLNMYTHVPTSPSGSDGSDSNETVISCTYAYHTATELIIALPRHP